MSMVVVLDQRDSKKQPDLVGEWQPMLNDTLGAGLTLPFTRTAGDEMQAVIGQPEAVGQLAELVLSDRSWWLGFGIGQIESPRPKDPREGRGSAFWAAREAINRAKGQRASRPVCVIGSDDSGETAMALEECLGALAFIITRRTDAQRRVAEEFTESAGSVKEVAERLDLTIQGARQRILAAGCEEQADLVRLTGRIANETTGGSR